MPRTDRICEFVHPGPLRDKLVAAVLRGEKTATTSLLSDWQDEGEPLPEPGEQQTVVDSGERPVARIEILEARVIALGDADDELAFAEGEGFRDVAEWRDAHEEFWRSQGRIDDDTQIVVEVFRLL